MKQTIILWAVLVTISVLWAAAPALPQDGDDTEVVATVYDEEITRGQLVAELLARHGYGVLQSMIEIKAIEHYAKANGFEASEADIDDLVAAARARINSQSLMTGKNFELWLAEQHLTLGAFRQQVRLQALLEQMVKDKVNVEDEEVGQFYDENQEKMAREEAMWTAHIVLATQDEAERVRARIVNGEIEWDEAARKYSIDPYGRDNAGLIGWVLRGDDPTRKAVFALENDGDISPVVHSEMGYSIFKRLSYRPGGIPTFEEVEDEIRELLLNRKLLQAMQVQRDSIVKMGDPQRLIHFGTEDTITPSAQ